MRWTGALALSLLASSASGQAQPDVREILAKVSALYKSASQYEIVAESRSADPTSNENSGRVHLAFQSPDRYRVEGASSGTAETGAIIVDDGSTIWLYFPQSNQYNSIPVSALKDEAAGELRVLRPESQDDSAMSRYRHADLSQEARRYLRDEAVEFSGAKVDCYVISVSLEKGGPSHTWWIDKKSYRVLRDDDAEASVVFSVVKLGEPLPDELFKFAPPAGAQEIK